jgi:hypothetical protein
VVSWQSGASLELRFLRLGQGGGELRPRFGGGGGLVSGQRDNRVSCRVLRLIAGWGGGGTKKVLEVRGGGVLFEPGAVRGDFVGVVFTDEGGTEEVSQLTGLTDTH